MNDARLTVDANIVVTVDYTLTLDDGEVSDSSDGGMPLRFLAGHGEILPALEAALMGMSVGDEVSVSLTASEGYGEYDEEATEEVPLAEFPGAAELEPGTQIGVEDEEGEVFDAWITEVRDDVVLLDYNHPMAGKNLHFHVKVLDLRPAAEEELEHGHAHGGHGHHHE